MKRKLFFSLLALVSIILFHSSSIYAQETQPVKPDSYFGFTPGSDRNLFTYEKLIGYLQELETVSSRIKLEKIGNSPLGKPMYIVFLSSEKNIAKLDEYKKMNKRLALDPNIPKHERDKMIAEGKVFVLGTLSMHSSEVGPAQSAPLIAYDLVTTSDEKKLEWLNNVVYMMVPNHNPDGMDMIVNNYMKYKGTKYEGASLPSVYHKYVGHDNNRDFVILSQEDTKAIAGIYNLNWFPQVMVEKHQMGSTGTRFFVPPNHDPIAENVPAGVFTWSGLFGQNMVNDMTRENLSGVSQHYLFDDYWPGSTETCIWKNVIGFLTEVASAKTATPIYIEPNELRVGGKGLSEYKKSINMLLPWEGGWWRLGDIVEYEIVSTMSILKTASNHREDILSFRNDICVSNVKAGQTQPPYYYIMPEKQHDQGELVNMVALLKEHGINLYTLIKNMTVEGRAYVKGDVVIPLAQPFRAFVKEVMEKQTFPERHYTPGGELIKPYDITSWSLPLHRNVASYEINTRVEVLEKNLAMIDDTYSLSEPLAGDAGTVILPVNANESFRTAFAAMEKGITVERLSLDVHIGGEIVKKGSFVVSLEGKNGEVARKLVAEMTIPAIEVSKDIELKSEAIEMPRIALVETYFHDMDAGWTRFVFDTYNIPFTIVHPDEIEKAEVSKNYDVIIFPDSNKDLLMEGKRKSGDSYYIGNYHPDYMKGMGKEGFEEIMTFIDKGGLIISWGQSTNLFSGLLKIKKGDETEEFQLPFRDISKQLTSKGLYIPGSLLKIEVLQDHPLTLGMPAETGVFSRGRPVFQTSVPGFDMDRRVIASHPEKEILMSGYAGNEEQLSNKSVMIWMEKGEGQLVLFGFNPQFRASSQASFKLLFNSILL